MADKCGAGQNFQEIADFCRCKFTEPLTDEIDRLQTENKWLKEAIDNVPTEEYGRAEREGCDSGGAWDSFLEKLSDWKQQALKGE